MQPHTVTAIVVGAALLVYFGYTRDATSGTGSNVKWGLFSSALAFVVFCALQLKDGLFSRPHPLLWRAVTGVSLLYMMILMFLFFQDVDDARQLLKYIDPALGVPLPERDYAAHCELWTPDDPSGNPMKNLWDTVKDEFFIGHIICWWCKTILLRDLNLVLVASVMFEFTELAFQHWLPNFAECWWDHILLDIIFCNGLGIVMGYFTLQIFDLKTYSWTGVTRIRTFKGTVKRAFGQFLPESLKRYHWGMFSSWKRFCYVLLLLFMITMVDLGAFFLKFLLWIPPPHPINICRLFVMFILTGPALREYYEFIIDPNVKFFGPNAWICTAVVTLETMITVKWGSGKFTQPAPLLVKAGWVLVGVSVLLVLFVYFPVRHYLEVLNKRQRHKAESTSQAPKRTTHSKKKPRTAQRLSQHNRGKKNSKVRAAVESTPSALFKANRVVTPFGAVAHRLHVCTAEYSVVSHVFGGPACHSKGLNCWLDAAVMLAATVTPLRCHVLQLGQRSAFSKHSNREVMSLPHGLGALIQVIIDGNEDSNSGAGTTLKSLPMSLCTSLTSRVESCCHVPPRVSASLGLVSETRICIWANTLFSAGFTFNFD
ncbi:phosphatidylserine synthase [Pelomyxa schiedti]|nr:phosphatidylserine synthase [Pelomyxa schiedti]